MFIKRWGCAVITTLCIFTAEAGNAAVVVDGGTPNQVIAFYADPIFSPTYSAAATKFRLASAVNFNSIQWWGVLYPTFSDVQNKFTLQILSADLKTVLDAVTLDGIKGTLTGASVDDHYQEIVYNASLPDTFLDAGDYFLSFSDVHGSQAAWAWETTDGGAQLGGDTYGNGMWTFDRTENLAFQLSEDPQQQVPEPRTLMLLAIGLIACYAFQRHHS